MAVVNTALFGAASHALDGRMGWFMALAFWLWAMVAILCAAHLLADWIDRRRGLP